MEAIVIKNLEFTWKEGVKPILSIDEFSLKQGSRLFIQGPSGSGKSTLLGLLSGILTPQKGSISLLGTPLNSLTSNARDQFRANHIGYIFQMFNLLPYLNVLDNVILPCQFSSIRSDKIGNSEKALKAEALRLLETLGLRDSELLNKPVTELSLGQQQRVAACRALMGSPEILIADEPTSALDANAQGDFLRLIGEECANNNITLVFVSHDERLAHQFDLVAHLKNGTLDINAKESVSKA